MKKIKNILVFQYILIQELCININYQLKHKELQDNDQIRSVLQRSYINHLASMTSNSIVSNLYKLLYEKNNYSLVKLDNLVKHEKCVKNNEDYNMFLEEFESIKEQAARLNVREIRDKYVAHLDQKREIILYDLIGISELIKSIEKAYKQIYRSITLEDIAWDYNDDLLAVIFDDLHNLQNFLSKEQ